MSPVVDTVGRDTHAIPHLVMHLSMTSFQIDDSVQMVARTAQAFPMLKCHSDLNCTLSQYQRVLNIILMFTEVKAGSWQLRFISLGGLLGLISSLTGCAAGFVSSLRGLLAGIISLQSQNRSKHAPIEYLSCHEQARVPNDYLQDVTSVHRLSINIRT